MDGHSALDTSQCKACGLVLLVLEYGDTTVLPGKRTVDQRETMYTCFTKLDFTLIVKEKRSGCTLLN